jgi:hypothetical protein
MPAGQGEFGPGEPPGGRRGMKQDIGHDSPGNAPGSGAVSSFERVSRSSAAPMRLAQQRHGHSTMARLSRQQGSLAGRSLADQQCGFGGDERSYAL